jgi:hypothetical protein
MTRSKLTSRADQYRARAAVAAVAASAVKSASTAAAAEDALADVTVNITGATQTIADQQTTIVAQQGAITTLQDRLSAAGIP